jgi:hypothetical protein
MDGSPKSARTVLDFVSKGKIMLGIHAFPCFAAPSRRPIEQSMFNCHVFAFALKGKVHGRTCSASN